MLPLDTIGFAPMISKNSDTSVHRGNGSEVQRYNGTSGRGKKWYKVYGLGSMIRSNGTVANRGNGEGSAV